jgi:hypothetical protein
MTNLQSRQEKIQAKRKQTPFREFLMEIVSWTPLVFHKNNGTISRFPDTSRSPRLVKSLEYSDMRDGQLPEVDFGDFTTQF